MVQHLSFGIGSQIFFVFDEAADFNYLSGKKLFDMVCNDASAIPCIMPMGKR